MIDAVSPLPKRVDEVADLAISGFERREIVDLAADMNGESVKVEARELREPIVHRASFGQRDAELAVASSSRDLDMRTRVNVGVDPEQRWRSLATLRRES
jgi:hypothetical protein